KPVLEAFRVWDEGKDAWAEMGDTATVSRGARIRIRIMPAEGEKRDLKVRLIREGTVIKEIPLRNGLDIELFDEYLNNAGKTYYRIDISGILLSNPIFVTVKGRL
ncbi:MAG TPA: hypothetical protein VF790_03945, partial [Dissulfurispiraceae bacterium]